jgi:hypothetical protein
MQRVVNEWKYVPDRTDLIIQSFKTGEVVISFYGIKPDYIMALRHLRWCFESSKGHAYATDLTAEIPKLLNCGTHKVYLWKYLSYLITGKVTSAWVRINLSEFRFGEGSILDSSGSSILWTDLAPLQLKTS